MDRMIFTSMRTIFEPKLKQNGTRMKPEWNQNGTRMEPEWDQNKLKFLLQKGVNNFVTDFGKAPRTL